MTKKDVYVVVDTPKKAKKLKKVLDMFGEKLNVTDSKAIEIGDYNGYAKLYTEFNIVSFNDVLWRFSTYSGNKTKVSIKELRNILAPEHLKKGDYVILRDEMYIKICEFESLSKVFEGQFVAGRCINLDGSEYEKTGGIFEDFIRYATPEEIALLNPKPKELEVGKWYKSLTCPQFLGIHLKKNRYGFDTSGVWFDNYNDMNLDHENTINNLTEATPQEVESALIEEAKRRYQVVDKLKDLEFGLGVVDFKKVSYYHDDNELWISSEDFNIQVFDNGKWAEVIKPEEIKDSDIATIEALHDVLLDNHKYDLNSKLLTNARELCKKLQNIVGGN